MDLDLGFNSWPGRQFRRIFVDRIRLCDRIRTISPTQPSLAMAILLQAAPCSSRLTYAIAQLHMVHATSTELTPWTIYWFTFHNLNWEYRNLCWSQWIQISAEPLLSYGDEKAQKVNTSNSQQERSFESSSFLCRLLAATGRCIIAEKGAIFHCSHKWGRPYSTQAAENTQAKIKIPRPVWKYPGHIKFFILIQR